MKTSTIMPGVVSSGMYHINRDATIAIAVPAIRRTKEKMLWPEVGDMARFTIIMAQTRRCRVKNSWVSCRKAITAIVIVAHATRNP